jgi:hypothetical protein
MLLDDLFPAVFLDAGDKDVCQRQPASVFLPDDVLARGLLSGLLHDRAHSIFPFSKVSSFDNSNCESTS